MSFHPLFTLKYLNLMADNHCLNYYTRFTSWWIIALNVENNKLIRLPDQLGQHSTIPHPRIVNYVKRLLCIIRVLICMLFYKSDHVSHIYSRGVPTLHSFAPSLLHTLHMMNLGQTRICERFTVWCRWWALKLPSGEVSNENL